MLFSEILLPSNCVSLAEVNSYKHSLHVSMFFMSTMERRGASLGTIPVLAPSPRTPECPQTQPPFPLPSTRSPALSSFPPHPGPQVSSLPQQAGTFRNRTVSKQDSLHSKMAIAWTCPHRSGLLSQKRLLHVLLLRRCACQPAGSSHGWEREEKAVS